MFTSSQVNYPALVKEAYALYRCVKKMTNNLQDFNLILRSDYKLLKNSCSLLPKIPKQIIGALNYVNTTANWNEYQTKKNPGQLNVTPVTLGSNRKNTS